MENRRPGTVRRFDDGIDRWEMIEARPAATLSGWIDSYCSYSEETGSFGARRELAATSGVLIFALGDPLEITGADGRTIVLQAGQGFVGGIADATSISRALGPQRGVHVFMPLAGLSAVIGAPLAEIANRVLPFGELAGAAARDLGARLVEAEDSADQFDLLDDFFTRRLGGASRDERVGDWAMTWLRHETPPSVDALAREAGWSRKHFTSRFRAEIGFTPQTFRRLARFERFSRAIARAPQDSLAMLALDAGYHDQAHMTREVQAFSAMTPGELRARLIPGQGGVRDD